MSHLVAATLLTLAPTPLDHVTADTDLSLAPGSPPLTDRSPRMRVAVLAAMVRLGAIDHGAGELRWFGESLGWASELDHARRLVARVRECPTLAEGAWVPDARWFAAEAAAYSAAAAAWRRRAQEYRDREPWEDWRAEALHAWARWMDAEGDRLASEACRHYGWTGGSWQRPRRVVLQECKEWMGEERWAAREWPE